MTISKELQKRVEYITNILKTNGCRGYYDIKPLIDKEYPNATKVNKIKIYAYVCKNIYNDNPEIIIENSLKKLEEYKKMW